MPSVRRIESVQPLYVPVASPITLVPLRKNRSDSWMQVLGPLVSGSWV